MGKPEAIIENYLKKWVTVLDGFTYKQEKTGRRGVPDRLCIFPYGIIAFVECKSQIGKLKAPQKREINRLIERGHLVYVTNTKYLIDVFITDIKIRITERMLSEEDAE